jgi:hypothetical protein
VDLPQRLVGAERRRDSEICDVVVDRLFVARTIAGDGVFEDDDVAVDVDLGFAPVFSAVRVSDQEAGESGVLDHDGVGDFGFDGADVDWVFATDDAVDYLVHFGL